MKPVSKAHVANVWQRLYTLILLKITFGLLQIDVTICRQEPLLLELYTSITVLCQLLCSVLY